jgi:hypothetical protein
MSPNLRRHSRNLVSNVRKFSRSFYGGSATNSSSSVNELASVKGSIFKNSISAKIFTYAQFFWCNVQNFSPIKQS